MVTCVLAPPTCTLQSDTGHCSTAALQHCSTLHTLEAGGGGVLATLLPNLGCSITYYIIHTYTTSQSQLIKDCIVYCLFNH